MLARVRVCELYACKGSTLYAIYLFGLVKIHRSDGRSNLIFLFAKGVHTIDTDIEKINTIKC